MAKPFPTAELSRYPTPATWKKQAAFDPTIRGTFESGDPFSRGRFTSLLYEIDFSYNQLSLTEQALIEEFERNVKIGADKFTFRYKNPQLDINQDWEMRLLAPIEYGIEPRNPTKFYAHLKMFGKEIEKMRTEIIDVEDLAAGADITTRPIFVNPKSVTLNSIGILTKGAPAGVDDGNTVIIALKDDAANAIVSKTYDADPQPPTNDYEDLGSLANESLNAGEHLTLSVTQGAAANMPAFSIIIEYYYTS